MAKETTAILRSVLYAAKVTDDVEDIREAIMAMCDGDDIAAVNERVAATKARQKQRNQQ
ncbi:hypothetical protein FACS1894217_14680 [Clostridia bacterium]|nr:hypothetical protein FACS1894217_14680 [Clostridia bacterium]